MSLNFILISIGILLLVQSITDEILMQQYLEKWDGKLPSVTGANDGVMIDVGQMMNE